MKVQICPLCHATMYLDSKPEGEFLVCYNKDCQHSKLIRPPKVKTNIAKTEVLGTATHRIPLHSLREIGKIIKEGDAKYGRDNALKGVGDKEFQEERLEHAIDHLLRYAQGDTEENHLAKVAWYCIYQLEWLRLEQQQQQ